MHSCLPGKKMPSCNKTVEKRFDQEKEDEYYERVGCIGQFMALWF